MPAARTGVGPLFVGGTGRSGTTIVGELLGAHSDLALVPVELRFHVDAGGLADLCVGTTDLQTFEDRLRSRWFRRPPTKSGGPRGLHAVTDEATMDAALARLGERHGSDPWLACGQFMEELLRPFCEASGARTWVEMTPPNAKQADALCRMFPDARVVHMVRDGRDVAASVARRSWGPNDILSAIDWWATQLVRIHEAVEGVDPTRVRTVRLESLVLSRRQEEYAALVEFAGLEDDEPMRRFFDETVRPAGVHSGRWQHGLDEEAQREVERRYADSLQRLEELGVSLPGA